MKLFVWDCFADSTVLAIAETIEQAVELIIEDINRREIAIYKRGLEPREERYHRSLLTKNNPFIHDCDSPFGSWEKGW